MSHEPLRAQLCAGEFRREARRAPGLFAACGLSLGLLLLPRVGVAAPAVVVLALLGLALGVTRAAALRLRARTALPWQLRLDGRTLRTRVASRDARKGLRARLREAPSEATDAVERSGIRALRLPRELGALRALAS